MPRIPVKKPPVQPDVQMQMAEIAVSEPEDNKEDIPDAEEPEEFITAVAEPVAALLTPDNLAQAMTAFADKQKVSIKTLLTTLSLSLDDQKIRLVSGSKSQADMIEPVRIDMLAFFRQYFGNNEIQLEIQVDATVESVSAQPYSAKEKLNAMVTDNPDLMYLIEKLNLKIR